MKRANLDDLLGYLLEEVALYGQQGEHMSFLVPQSTKMLQIKCIHPDSNLGTHHKNSLTLTYSDTFCWNYESSVFLNFVTFSIVFEGVI